MSHKAAKLGLTSLVLVLAFGGLLYSTLSDGAEYYKHVDEVMANPDAWNGKRLQVHGFVVPNSIGHKGTLEYRFDIQNNGKVIHAYYTGILPDTFKAESEVVLSGKLSARGFDVQKDGVMAKCPSKYTPKGAGSAGAE